MLTKFVDNRKYIKNIYEVEKFVPDSPTFIFDEEDVSVLDLNYSWLHNFILVDDIDIDYFWYPAYVWNEAFISEYESIFEKYIDQFSNSTILNQINQEIECICRDFYLLNYISYKDILLHYLGIKECFLYN